MGIKDVQRHAHGGFSYGVAFINISIYWVTDWIDAPC